MPRKTRNRRITVGICPSASMRPRPDAAENVLRLVHEGDTELRLQ